MQIDPKTQSIILGILTALGILAAMSPSVFPSFIPPGEAADIIKTAGFVSTIATGVGAAMGLWSSSKPGVLAPADPPVVAAATRLADLPPSASAGEVNRAKTAVTNAAATHNPGV
jgi:hypothetical protein